MKISIPLFFIGSIVASMLQAVGFCAGTRIQTAQGPVLIEHIKPGMHVTCFNFHDGYESVPVANITPYQASCYTILRIGNFNISCASDQKFFLSMLKNDSDWKEVQDFVLEEDFPGNLRYKFPVLSITKMNSPITLYNIKVPYYNNFLLYDGGLIVGNFN